MRALLVGLLLVSAQVRDAKACSCEPVDTVVPANGATAVPTNTVLFVRAATAPVRFALRRTSDDAPVTFTTERHGSGPKYAYVLRPADLAREATYELDVYGSDDTSPWRRTQFTTGTAADTTPPTIDTLAGFEPHTMVYPGDGSCIDTCASPRDGRVSFAHLDYALPADAAYALLEIRDDAGSVVDDIAVTGEQVLGTGVCDAPSPHFVPDATYCARLRIFDHAGNEATTEARCSPARGRAVERDLSERGYASAACSASIA